VSSTSQVLFIKIHIRIIPIEHLIFFRKTKLYEQSKHNFVIRVDHIIIKNIIILALIKLIFIIKADVKA
jgi:hypothetical protein